MRAMSPSADTGGRTWSSADLALGLALASLCCCPCASVPALLVAGGTAIQSRSRGERIPAKALAAMAASALTLAASIVGTAHTLLTNHARSAAVHERADAARGAAEMTTDDACALVHELLLERRYEPSLGLHGEPACTGSLEVDGRLARLGPIDVDLALVDTVSHRLRLTACLARGHRWFVYRITEAADCALHGVAEPLASLAAIDDDATEAAFTQAQEKADEEARVQRFRSSLAQLDAALRAAPRAEASCPLVEWPPYQRAPAAGEKLEVGSVDRRILNARTGVASAAEPPWWFLTSHRVRVALDTTASRAGRASAVRQLALAGGPYLLVYDMEAGAWPTVSAPEGLLVSRYDVTYTPGSFEGWVSLVDLERGSSLCAAHLAFASTKDLNVHRRKLGPGDWKDVIRDRVLNDLEGRFEDEATTVIGQMTHGRVWPGYKIFDAIRWGDDRTPPPASSPPARPR